MAGIPGFRRWFGPLTVILAAAMLTALTWIGAFGTIRTQHAQTVARAENEAANKALVLEEQLRRQLLAIDQTLRIIELEWQRDPERFDIHVWSDQLVVIADASLQIFVTDENGIVRASSRPEIIGNDVGGRDYFRYEKGLAEDDGRMFIGRAVQGLSTRLWQLNLVRRLDRAMPGVAGEGVFAGVISASYDTGGLGRFYSGVDLGPRGLIAVIAGDGGLRSLVGPAGAPDANFSGTAMWQAIQRNSGTWIGPSAPDGLARIHAFRRVPDRDLTVVVGYDEADAMADAALWRRSATLFAGGITALLLLLTWLLLREVQATRRRLRALAEDRAILAESNAWAQAKTAQMEATFTGMTDGVMMLDAELRLLEWNQHFPEQIGIDPAMLRVGLPMEEILRAQAEAGEFGPVDVETEVARRLEAMRTGASSGTIERVRPNGRTLELRRKPVAGGGYVTLYTDVTGRRRAEERMRQAELMASIGRLTSGVAHDFNNLLASIAGNGELLQRDLAHDPRHGRRVAIVVQAAARGAALVRQLLAFSRQQPLMPSAVDLNGAVQAMVELLRTMLGSTIRIAIRLDPALWTAMADPVQIEHVILNLAINARDAMPEGGVLTIATENTTIGAAPPPAMPAGVAQQRSEMAPGRYVMVSVGDTGTGIEAAVLRQVFEPFFTTKAPGKGSGLGLSQVYGVASQSGGGVRITTVLGRGTTVEVYFPRADAEVQAGPASAVGRSSPALLTPGLPVPGLPVPGLPVSGLPVPGLPVPGHPVTGLAPTSRGPLAVQRPRILLVDDDQTVRETVAGMLSAEGYVTVEADAGPGALRRFETGERFDLMLVDFAMPDMNGAELAAAARRWQPGLPVVLMTGFRDEERIGGERWVLMKPFRMAELVDILSEALSPADATG